MKLYSPFLLILSSVFLWTEVFARDWKEGAELRRSGDLKKAQSLLRKYQSPAGFDRLNPSEKLDYLKSLLELAHVKALNHDVSGALTLLNWAEGRSDDYQRAISCCKYAEILLDLGEFERAESYLKNTNEIIVKHLKDDPVSGAALGQGGEIADTSAAWNSLQNETEYLQTGIEMENLKKKYGVAYAQYAKLRRLQRITKRTKNLKYLNEALKLADEIINKDSMTQFSAAAGYLKGAILDSKLTEKSPRKEIKETKDYLEKFIRQQPEGLYRSEALMLLGKISMEIEWNIKDAENDYEKALQWFRTSRQKRDALSLYASMNDDLKNQVKPTQKSTTLNQWKRTVYHLQAAAEQKYLVAAPEETKKLSEKERLKVAVSDYLFISEKFEDAVSSCRELQKQAKTPECMALALIGEADALRMLSKPDVSRIQKLYKRIYSEKQFSKTAAVPRALYSGARIAHQAGKASNQEFLKMLEQCCSKYPKSRYGQASLFHLAVLTREAIGRQRRNMRRNSGIAMQKVLL